MDRRQCTPSQEQGVEQEVEHLVVRMVRSLMTGKLRLDLIRIRKMAMLLSTRQTRTEEVILCEPYMVNIDNSIV